MAVVQSTINVYHYNQSVAIKSYIKEAAIIDFIIEDVRLV